MKISVLIPTYNSAKFIAATLESVIRQTVSPDEILVLDDGSTDDTVQILKTYHSRITVMQQKNGGVAHARNVLYARSSGDLIAFLDHDDLWHPDYIKTQKKLYEKNPKAVAFFTGHTIVYDDGDYTKWETVAAGAQAEEIPPVEFIKRYHQAIGAFMSMSFCCVPKAAFQRLGNQPFCEVVSGVDDCYLFHQLPFFGSVIYYPAVLAAYRVTQTAQSADRIKGAGLSVRAMELLMTYYRDLKDARMLTIFRWAFAAQRREYGKVLMGGSKVAEARRQFLLSIGTFWHPASAAKSLGLLLFSYMPRLLQPRWLPTQTVVQSADLI